MDEVLEKKTFKKIPLTEQDMGYKIAKAKAIFWPLGVISSSCLKRYYEIRYDYVPEKKS